MPIGGSATELNITGAKLKVAGGVQVAGSIAYTTDATGFGSVTAQIDNNNTLNITSGKLTGVAKIERNTAATITAITHTNVNNNTTIHLALKNTATSKGVFITLGTFASDDTVKVNYTDNYLIGPGETGMITLRKVNGVLSLFVREMFTSKATSFDNTDNSPFYIKDGVNYKYPLYKFAGTDLTSEVIQGTTYYKPSTGITTQTRPPKGLPELIVSPSGNLAIGNSQDLTTVNYDVWGVSTSFDFGSITDGNDVTHARFLLTDGEASGSFTESGASSGDSYKLYIEKTDTTSTDTVVSTTQSNVTIKIAFHHGAFTASDYSSAYSTVSAAATAGHVYSDTTPATYTWGTLNSVDTSTSGQTGYSWTPASAITADVLMVAGGGAGGSDNSGGGGAGGLIFKPSISITGSQTITVGAGADAIPNQSTVGQQGVDTTFGSLTAKGGGCGANGNGTTTPTANMIGGSGGGGDGENARPTGGTASQSSQSGDSGTYGYGNAGGNGESSQGAGGGGGGAGTSGANGSSATNEVGGVGGDGLKEVTIGGTLYNFATIYGAIYGEVLSGESWFAGGGAGGNNNNRTTDVNGGKGGGGKGLGSDDLTDNIVRYGKAHTGGGGGGGTFGSNTESYAGGGGSGIVLVKFTGDIVSGKDIAKLTGISNVTTGGSKTINYTFNKQGTGIDKVTYKIGSGSEVTTASGVYTLAYTPADFGTTTITHAYTVDSSGNQLGIKFGPYSVTTQAASLGHLSTPILLFMDMGTTVTDSINSIAITQHTGTHTKNTSTNSIKNTGPGTMVIDFTSLRTSASSDVTITWEVYLESGVTWEEGFSIGNITASNASADSVGYLGGTNPTLHFEGNGQTNQTVSGSNISYSSYEGTWVQHTWNYTAGSNTIKTYINGALACSASPNSGTFEPESYFWLFCHARDNNVTSRPGDTNLICRNIEIYQASFTDAQILAAYES